MGENTERKERGSTKIEAQSSNRHRNERESSPLEDGQFRGDESPSGNRIEKHRRHRESRHKDKEDDSRVSPVRRDEDGRRRDRRRSDESRGRHSDDDYDIKHSNGDGRGSRRNDSESPRSRRNHKERHRRSSRKSGSDDDSEGKERRERRVDERDRHRRRDRDEEHRRKGEKDGKELGQEQVTKSSGVMESHKAGTDGKLNTDNNANVNLGRSGGVYIPPFKLARMMKEVQDKSSVEYQRLTWDALRKSINGLLNKVNATNIKIIIAESFAENLIRG